VQRYELHGERDDVRHSAVSAAVRLLGDELRRGVSESRG
jgi:hypothetical protein